MNIDQLILHLHDEEAGDLRVVIPPKKSGSPWLPQEPKLLPRAAVSAALKLALRVQDRVFDPDPRSPSPSSNKEPPDAPRPSPPDLADRKLSVERKLVKVWRLRLKGAIDVAFKEAIDALLRDLVPVPSSPPPAPGDSAAAVGNSAAGNSIPALTHDDLVAVTQRVLDEGPRADSFKTTPIEWISFERGVELAIKAVWLETLTRQAAQAGGPQVVAPLEKNEEDR